MSRGRKNKYESHIKPYLEEIAKWAEEGLTEATMIKNLGVSHTTFYEYKSLHTELADAIKKGRAPLISRIRGALVKRAEGFKYEEKKTYTKVDEVSGNKTSYMEITKKYCPPDVAAINLFLKNYDKENWANDPQTLELKKMEFELRKKIAEEKEW